MPRVPTASGGGRARKPAPVEFVFAADAAGSGCSQVVRKAAVKAIRKKQRQASREKALRKSAKARQSAEELSQEAQAAQELDTLDRNKVWRSIRALSASQLKGWKLREWQEQQRRELGAKATKATKVPMKIRAGILKKRKVVMARAEERIREAGVVTASHKGNKKKRMRKPAVGGRGTGDAGDVGDAGVRGGVMNVSYLLKK